MRRVLLTVHKFFPDHRAGTEVLTLKVAQELKRRGYEVRVLTADPPDRDARHFVGPEIYEHEYEGVVVHVVGESLRLKGYTFRHEYLHPQIGAYSARLIADFAPDLVHGFHLQNLSASVLEAAFAASVPAVLSTTDFWLVCPVVQLKRPNGQVCRGPAPLAANCLTCYTPRLFAPLAEFRQAVTTKRAGIGHAVEALPAALSEPVWKALYASYAACKLPEAIEATVARRAALRDLANKVSAIMVPTRLMRDIFVANGIRAELIHDVPFGLDTEPLLPYQAKTPSDVLRIGFIGTLFEHKGVDLLIKAFQRLPGDCRAVLKIYGDVKQFPEYSQMLVALTSAPSPRSIDIEFAGTFPNAKLGEVLSSLDVLVVPSRWYENTPLVIQSALATRTPVIATDLGGMSELVKHEVNGLLFALNDVEGLARQLIRLCRDRGLVEQLRSNIGPQRTMAEMVDDIERVYDMTLSQPGHACLV